MIERNIRTGMPNTPSVLNPIYKMMIVLMLLKHSTSEKGVTIGRIQVYLWGMSSRKNRSTLSSYRKNGMINELPITPDSNLRILLTEVEQRGWIEQVEDNQNKMRYLLTLQGQAFLYNLRNMDIYKEIETGFKEIGNLPETKLNNINYIWNYDVF